MEDSGGNAVNVGKRIRCLREARGWTIGELARKAEISPSYMLQIEHGRSIPGAKFVRSLARALGVKAEYILGMTDEPYDNTDLPQEIREIWESLKNRPDLQRLVATARPLTREQVESICTLISQLSGKEKEQPSNESLGA